MKIRFIVSSFPIKLLNLSILRIRVLENRKAIPAIGEMLLIVILRRLRLNWIKIPKICRIGLRSSKIFFSLFLERYNLTRSSHVRNPVRSCICLPVIASSDVLSLVPRNMESSSGVCACDSFASHLVELVVIRTRSKPYRLFSHRLDPVLNTISTAGRLKAFRDLWYCHNLGSRCKVKGTAERNKNHKEDEDTFH